MEKQKFLRFLAVHSEHVFWVVRSELLLTTCYFTLLYVPELLWLLFNRYYGYETRLVVRSRSQCNSNTTVYG